MKKVSDEKFKTLLAMLDDLLVRIGQNEKEGFVGLNCPGGYSLTFNCTADPSFHSLISHINTPPTYQSFIAGLDFDYISNFSEAQLQHLFEYISSHFRYGEDISRSFTNTHAPGDRKIYCFASHGRLLMLLKEATLHGPH